MSSRDNKQTPETRSAVEKLERVTVETIETIERVTITGVATTAKIVTEFVHVTADMVVQAQQEFERRQEVYDSIEIGPEISPEIEAYYVIDSPTDPAQNLPDNLDAAQRAEQIRLQEIETSIIEELSDEIIISEHSEQSQMNTAIDPERIDPELEEDDMHMHIQNQEIHIQGAADASGALPSDTIQYEPVKILVRKSALLAAKAHAEEDVRNEVGGILLGDYYTTEDGERVALIAGIVRARKARQRPASLNFTPEAWADVWRLIDGDEEYGAEKTPWKMMGWYHTHPNFGIFFSGADHSVHDPHFTHPCHVALVIDPCRREFGFFAKPNVYTPAGHCHQNQCKTLGDKDLIKRWKANTEQSLKLPKAEIPAGALEEETAAAEPPAKPEASTGSNTGSNTDSSTNTKDSATSKSKDAS